MVRNERQFPDVNEEKTMANYTHKERTSNESEQPSEIIKRTATEQSSTSERVFRLDTIVVNVQEYERAKEFYEHVFNFKHLLCFDLLDENEQHPPQPISIFEGEGKTAGLKVVGCYWKEANPAIYDYPRYCTIILSTPSLERLRNVLEKRHMNFERVGECLRIVDQDGIAFEIFEDPTLTFRSQIIGLQVEVPKIEQTKKLLSEILEISEERWSGNPAYLKLTLDNAFIEFLENENLLKRPIDPYPLLTHGINRATFEFSDFKAAMENVQMKSPDIIEEAFEIVPGLNEVIFADYDQIIYSITKQNSPRILLSLVQKRLVQFISRKERMQFKKKKRNGENEREKSFINFD